jgi:hypothetical protein
MRFGASRTLVAVHDWAQPAIDIQQLGSPGGAREELPEYLLIHRRAGDERRAERMRILG